MSRHGARSTRPGGRPIGCAVSRSLAASLVALLVAVAGGAGLDVAPALANTTINVNTTFDPPTPHAGTCSLREAILFADGAAEPECAPGAPSGTTLVVVPASPSHYLLSTGSALSVTSGSVVIRGGGVGALGTTLNGEGLTRVLFVGPRANVTLDGLTVTGGQTPAGDSGGCGGAGCNSPGGGGILNLGSLTLNSAAVMGNGTGDGGGGNPGLPGGNGGDGGGIDNAGTLTVNFSAISANRTGAGGAGGGGAGCGADAGAGGFGGGGGGVFNQGTLSVTGSTITANTTGAGGTGGTGSTACLGGGAGGGLGGAGGAGGQGGGIFNHGGTLALSDSTLDANRTGGGGSGGNGGSGACAAPPGGIPICDCKGGNAGAAANGGVGGAIASDLALDALNATIVSNGTGPGGNGGTGGTFPTAAGCAGTDGASGRGGSGGGGGGVAQLAGGVTLTNLTISLNFEGNGGIGSPDGFAGAGSGIDVFGGSLTEANTIVSANDCFGSIADGGFNLWFAGASGCPGNFGNPELGPLQNNGGATQTMALGVGSAAIDRLPASPTSCPPTDQRGFLRPDGEATCDIGAYESGASPTNVKVIAGLATPPRFFSLKPHGSVQRGAMVVAVLHTPRVLVLVVRKLESHSRLIVVGLVRLGLHPAGRSTFHWDLRVGGHRLDAGHYQIVMYALGGNVLSRSAVPGARTLIVQANGRVRA